MKYFMHAVMRAVSAHGAMLDQLIDHGLLISLVWHSNLKKEN